MENIWFTSDFHFGHAQSFIYEKRGFYSVEEMNESIVDNWNKMVRPQDIVYCLGDICLGVKDQSIKYFNRLNGEFYAIWGNHDTPKFLDDNAKICDGWYANIITYKKINIYLSHYPTITSNFDDKGFKRHVINFHGHTHQVNNWMFSDNPFIYHVGMDSHQCKPVNLEEAIKEIHMKWDKLGFYKE